MSSVCCFLILSLTMDTCKRGHTATHCNTLDTATHCNTLQHNARKLTLKHTAAHCKTVDIAKHCNTLAFIRWIPVRESHCNTLQHTATHCNTLQHTATHLLLSDGFPCESRTATHCNTLQHTATHCNTLQHTCFYQMDPRARVAVHHVTHQGSGAYTCI